MKEPILKIAYGVLLLVVLAIVIRAEENPSANSPVFRVQSNTVLAPTLVMKESGEFVHGLKPDDFIVSVDGREQPFQLNESPDSEKISTVVAVQTGGSAHFLFDEDGKEKQAWEQGGPLSGLGTMVEHFIGGLDAEVAIVAFDSRVRLVQDFTRDLPVAMEKLNGLEAGDDGAPAILNAVDLASGMFRKAEPGRRQILFLISESRDYTSKTVKAEPLVERLAAGNIQIHSIAFQPLRQKLADDLKSSKPAKNDKMRIELGQIIAAGRAATNVFKKSTVGTLVEGTGGEHLLFSDKSSLEAAFVRLANNFRNTYLISFQAPDARPGLHVIRIRLRDDLKDMIVRSRSSYRAKF